MRKMMFHQVAAKLIKREIWIWKFLCNCKVYDSKSCKERQDLQVVEMTSGYPWTTKSSQTIREVYSGTYIHTYIHIYIKGWHKRSSNCTQSLSPWHHFSCPRWFTYCFPSHLWSKVVCFVLFCLPRWDLPNCGAYMLLASSESSRWVRVTWLGLRLFGATVWKLLIINPFYK
jgi:hypothetical protein